MSEAKMFHAGTQWVVRTISGSSGGVKDCAEVNVCVIAPGETVDGVARLIASAPDLLSERDSLRAEVAELRAALLECVQALEAELEAKQ